MARFLLLDLDHLQGQSFAFFLTCEYLINGDDRANITIAIIRYLPANGSTVNVVCHDLNIHLQDHKFWNVNISKMVSDSAKIPLMAFM